MSNNSATYESILRDIIELLLDVLRSWKFWFIALGFAAVGLHLKSAVDTADRDIAIEIPLRKTPGGVFALDTMQNCLNSGSMFGAKPHTARCITETVTAAKNIGGEPFGNEVSAALKQKYLKQM